MKTCSKCGAAKPLSCYNKQSAPRTDFSTICKQCVAAYRRIWNAANTEKRRTQRINWRAANKDKTAAQDARRYAANKEKMDARVKAYKAAHPEATKASNARWDKNNPSRRTAMVAQRRAMKHRAMPSWADEGAIAQAYALARLLTARTGEKHHVDHIVPLKSTLVCGLHVEHNLQVIPASHNSQKKNYYWPDMP